MEGDLNVVKRAEKMLYIDHVINTELEKAYELFDMYARMPMVEEFTWMNKVLEVIGSDSQKAEITKEDLMGDNHPKNINQINETMERYEKAINRRENLMNEIDSAMSRK